MQAGSGAYGGAMERQMVVSAIDDIYPSNFPSTCLDEAHG